MLVLVHGVLLYFSIVVGRGVILFSQTCTLLSSAEIRRKQIGSSCVAAVAHIEIFTVKSHFFLVLFPTFSNLKFKAPVHVLCKNSRQQGQNHE